MGDKSPPQKRQKKEPDDGIRSDTASQDDVVEQTNELVFSHDPDLRLVVGSDKHVLLVHSCLLDHYCPELKCKATRSPCQAQAEQQQQQLELPEDDITTWNLLCRVIYGRRLAPPERISAQSMLALAILANKYGCGDRLLYGSAYCFQHLHYTDVRDCWPALIAAYMFRQSSYFQKYTKLLTSSCRKSFFRFAKDCPDARLGIKLCCMKASFPFYLYSECLPAN
ncbi:hypothetical protein E4U54_008261 [Claviceps lovelessii]|nr:hypothetical protein E4U54_008261 [Claviceps lovelessii]